MLSKAHIQILKSLQNKKGRIQHQLFLVEGEKIVSELLSSDWLIESIFIIKGLSSDFIVNNLGIYKNIEMIEVNASEMEKISIHPTPPSVLALVRLPSEVDSHFLETLQYPILGLEDVQDAGNLGTIIRIADWFGFKTIITSFSTASWHNPKVIQASMGSFLRIPVIQTDLKFFLERTSKIIFGAQLHGLPIYETPLHKLDILVLGNESKGISMEINSLITHSISIPSFGKAESLNVAVAGGIICAEWNRQKMLAPSIIH